jgi:hypothetical protein
LRGVQENSHQMKPRLSLYMALTHPCGLFQQN